MRKSVSAWHRGSSPLARGPLHQLKERVTGGGLIPARAGTTLTIPALSGFARAHPRSRGDHQSPSRSVLWHMGSSPLARGPLRMKKPSVAPTRLIPARAGTTMEASSSRTFTRAHPRSRGDHCRVIMSRMFIRGSSPLARGPPDVNQRIFDASGLIPARAGTTGVTS